MTGEGGEGFLRGSSAVRSEARWAQDWVYVVSARVRMMIPRPTAELPLFPLGGQLLCLDSAPPSPSKSHV